MPKSCPNELSCSDQRGSLATDVAKDTLQRELQRRLGEDKSGKSGSDPVGDVLKGLFGKPKR